MRISLVRSGGVAGVRRAIEIDTSRLHPRLAEELQQLVERAPAPEAGGGGRKGTPGAADRFRYRLAVDDGQKQCAWTFDEERPPEDLRPLVEAVRNAAKSTDSGSDPETA
jgi:hypothetical protein